jgi:hypothetical protein
MGPGICLNRHRNERFTKTWSANAEIVLPNPPELAPNSTDDNVSPTLQNRHEDKEEL